MLVAVCEHKIESKHTLDCVASVRVCVCASGNVVIVANAAAAAASEAHTHTLQLNRCGDVVLCGPDDP